MQGALLSLLSLLLVALAPQLCQAHGKLTKPTPRDGISVGRAGLDENNPVSFEPGCTQENTCDAFVCREATPNPNVPVTQVQAGRSLELGWMFAALHVGDCSAYVSYDVDKPRSQQKYVKIANLPDCKSYASRMITIPSILPAGRAILRWDWIALHLHPKTELFVQCADINIQSSSSVTASDLDADAFSITNPPIYPNDANDGVGYANKYGGGNNYMTGPSCIDGDINDCSLTAPGTPGNTDNRRGGGSNGSGSGGNSGGSGGAIPTPPPTRPAVSDINKCCWGGCGGTCVSDPEWCAVNEERCVGCSGQFCPAVTAPPVTLAPTPRSTPYPTVAALVTLVPTAPPTPYPTPSATPLVTLDPTSFPTPVSTSPNSILNEVIQLRAALEAERERADGLAKQFSELQSSCSQLGATTSGGRAPTTTQPGACVSNDPNVDYSVACQALEANCEQFSFCMRIASLTQLSTKHSPSPDTRRLRALRSSTHHSLIQQEANTKKQGKFANDGMLNAIGITDEDQLDRASHFSHAEF